MQVPKLRSAVFLLTSIVTIDGSDSLITVRVMIALGIEPHIAVATNMFAAVVLRSHNQFVRRGIPFTLLHVSRMMQISGKMAETMHEGPVPPSQFPDLTATPAHVSAAWKTFVLRVVDAPRRLTATYSNNLIGMVISAPRDHRVRAEIDGRVCEGYGHAGSVSFVPAGVKTQVEGTRCPRLAALFVPDEFLHRVITEHWEADPNKIEMFWQFQVRDPVIEAVITSLRFEAENQAPSGQLYAESACEFLAHHIIRSYSSLSPPVPRLNGGLPGKRLKLVHEYIEDNLGEPIALRDLAALAGVSARHFGRAFRQALGVPPHAYVLTKRLAAARDLLINQPLLTIGEIASKTGFSSSSHLASAFRRHCGCSPIALRKQR